MELQAVILAGGASDNVNDLNTPKPLLTIGKKKLVWYPARWLKNSGFVEIIIITLESLKFPIEEAIFDLNLSVKYIIVEDDPTIGTLQSISLLQHHIKTDLLVVNCDIITDMELYKFMDVHRANEAAVTIFLGKQSSNLDNLPGSKSHLKDQETDREFVGLIPGDHQCYRVMFLQDDLDLSDENLRLERLRMKQLPNLLIRADLQDVHLYIVKKWLVQAICTEKYEGSFKIDFLSMLVNQQFKSNLNPDIYSLLHEYRPMDQQRLEMKKSLNQLNISLKKKRNEDFISTVNAYISQDQCFVLCVSNEARFVQANRLIFRPEFPFQESLEPRVHPTTSLASKVTISVETLLDERSVVEERSNVKRSVVGKCCKIAAGCKISNSIIMDHVNIASGSSIQGSIICPNTSIGEKCELKDCFVASGRSIKANSKLFRESILDGELE